jgi:hypothetical protein
MRKHHRWTDEQKTFLIETVGDYESSQAAAKAFNEKFGTSLSNEAIKTFVWKRLGLKFTSAKYRHYTDAEKTFIAENAETMTMAELSDELFRLFGRKTSLYSVANYVEKTLGIKHGYLNKACIGAEVVKSDGYTYIKIADEPRGGGKNWVSKQRVVYERIHNVTLQSEYHVVFLNGNKQDFRKENLYALPKRFIPIMSKNKWWSDNPELTLAAIKWCELFYTIREVGKGD